MTSGGPGDRGAGVSRSRLQPPRGALATFLFCLLRAGQVAGPSSQADSASTEEGVQFIRQPDAAPGELFPEDRLCQLDVILAPRGAARDRGGGTPGAAVGEFRRAEAVVGPVLDRPPGPGFDRLGRDLLFDLLDPGS